MKDFEVKTKIYFGDDALAHLGELKTDRVFIVADPFTVSSGLIDHITNPLKKNDISYSIFSKVVADPPVEVVIAGVKEALACKGHYIVAVGGGSAMDTSKAIRKFATQIDETYHPKLICIPTTSGTGSEVTSFAVISDTEHNTKIPLISDDMTPEEAILDEVW